MILEQIQSTRISFVSMCNLNFSRDLVFSDDNVFPPFKFLSRSIQSDMCVRSIKRPDAIQMALRAIVSGDFRTRAGEISYLSEYRERVNVISYPALWSRNDSNQFGGS